MKKDYPLFGYAILPTTVNNIYVLIPFSYELNLNISELQNEHRINKESQGEKELLMPMIDGIAVKIDQGKLQKIIPTMDDLLQLMMEGINLEQGGAVPVLKSLILDQIRPFAVPCNFCLRFFKDTINWTLKDHEGNTFDTYPMSIGGYTKVFNMMYQSYLN